MQVDRIIQEPRHQVEEALGTTLKPVCQCFIIIKTSIRATLILDFEQEFKILGLRVRGFISKELYGLTLEMWIQVGCPSIFIVVGVDNITL